MATQIKLCLWLCGSGINKEKLNFTQDFILLLVNLSYRPMLDIITINGESEHRYRQKSRNGEITARNMIQ